MHLSSQVNPGMEPVAMLRSQLSAHGQFQDGSEDISVCASESTELWHYINLSIVIIMHCQYLTCTLHLILLLLHALYDRSCTVHS